MKLIKVTSKTFSPTRLFTYSKNKKDRSRLSRSEPPSFGSATSSSSTSTPTSVLPRPSLPQLSGDWSDFSDTNNDARVSRKELEALLGLFGAEPPSEQELKMVLGEVDRDGDAIVSVETLMSRVGPACDTELRDTFEIFDADHDGRITAEELFTVFTTIGERCTLEDCRRMIAGVDKNGDGFVCFDDFARMMDCQR